MVTFSMWHGNEKCIKPFKHVIPSFTPCWWYQEVIITSQQEGGESMKRMRLFLAVFQDRFLFLCMVTWLLVIDQHFLLASQMLYKRAFPRTSDVTGLQVSPSKDHISHEPHCCLHLVSPGVFGFNVRPQKSVAPVSTSVQTSKCSYQTEYYVALSF